MTMQGKQLSEYFLIHPKYMYFSLLNPTSEDNYFWKKKYICGLDNSGHLFFFKRICFVCRKGLHNNSSIQSLYKHKGPHPQ